MLFSFLERYQGLEQSTASIFRQRNNSYCEGKVNNVGMSGEELGLIVKFTNMKSSNLTIIN
jgi:hypothetical protein